MQGFIDSVAEQLREGEAWVDKSTLQAFSQGFVVFADFELVAM
tara:strand:- start:196 stop:324 length:129 start_codon:yes stop_codon:yes gene_type:complete